MILFPDTLLENIAIHKVGNRANEDGVVFSKSVLTPGEEIKNVLMAFFLSPFKSNELYNLHHENELEMNEIYNFVSKIFEDPDLLFDQSINIANHLYEKSTHPKIKAGELYICYFKNCILEEEEADAIGIFKSESRETFLKVFMHNDNYNVETQDGININKLDKGCLIFNTEKERGYVVAIVDNVNKSDAVFWKDEFLKVCERNDDFFQTKETIKLCKTFIEEKLPQEFEITKADQADFYNRSVAYFKEKDEYSIEDFSREVIKQPEIIESFNDFKETYEENHDMKFSPSFNIEESAVKQQAKVMKSIIKLDKNFHVYVHGGRDKIVKGYDEEKGLNFYQLFYKDEK